MEEQAGKHALQANMLQPCILRDAAIRSANFADLLHIGSPSADCATLARFLGNNN